MASLSPSTEFSSDLKIHQMFLDSWAKQRYIIEVNLKAEGLNEAQIENHSYTQENLRGEVAIRLQFVPFLIKEKLFDEARMEVNQTKALAGRLKVAEGSLEKCELLISKITELEAVKQSKAIN